MDTERFRTALLEERTRIQGALEYLDKENPGSLEDETEEIMGSSDNHLGDAASGTLDREIDYSLQANSQEILSEIEAALQRIDDGTYGKCETCGGDIPEERLEAMPWARYDVEHQRQLEQG